MPEYVPNLTEAKHGGITITLQKDLSQEIIHGAENQDLFVHSPSPYLELIHIIHPSKMLLEDPGVGPGAMNWYQLNILMLSYWNQPSSVVVSTYMYWCIQNSTLKIMFKTIRKLMASLIKDFLYSITPKSMHTVGLQLKNVSIFAR